MYFINKDEKMSSDRVSKPLLVSRLIQLIKSNSKKPIFKSFELGSLEATLKDDVFKHNWIYQAICTIVNESCVVSSENIHL